MTIEFHKFQLSGRDQEERYKASSYRELSVSITRYIIKALFGTSESRYYNAKNKIDNSLKTEKLLIDTLIEMKPVVMGDKEE